MKNKNLWLQGNQNVFHLSVSCFWRAKTNRESSALFIGRSFLQKRQSHLDIATPANEAHGSPCRGLATREAVPFGRPGFALWVLRSLMCALSIIPPSLSGSFASIFHQSLFEFLRYEKQAPGQAFENAFLTLLHVLILRDQPGVQEPVSLWRDYSQFALYSV